MIHMKTDFVQKYKKVYGMYTYITGDYYNEMNISRGGNLRFASSSNNLAKIYNAKKS